MRLPASSLSKTLESVWAERHLDYGGLLERSAALLEQATKHNDGLAVGLAHRNLGFAEMVSGGFERAWHHLKCALEAGRQHDSPHLIADAHNFIAGTYKNFGNSTSALQHLELALQTLEAIGDIAETVPIKYNIATLLQSLGQHERAIEAYYKALELLKKYPHPVRELEVQGNLAQSLVALNRADEAMLLFERVVVMTEQQKLPLHHVRNLINMGEAYDKLGRPEEALAVLQRAYPLFQDEVVAEGRPFCLLYMARARAQLGHQGEALVTLQEAQQQANQLGILPLQKEIALARYEIAKQTQSFAMALEALETHNDILERIRAGDAERQLQLFTLERDFEKAVTDAEIHRLKNVELARVLTELEGKTAQLEQLLQKDVLTGVHTRRFLEEALALEWDAAQRDQRALSVALLDIDNFKMVNDQFSHRIGDQVLFTIGDLMRQVTGTRAIAARYGGEEFVLALPETPLPQAVAICEHLRWSIECYPWQELHPELRITASIGISADAHVEHFEKLLDLADQEMYRAKRLGKNRVCAEGRFDEPRVNPAA
jgi:diguanylate cyclase (GGDEF)-like protein